MQFALLIYETPEAFASRKNDETDSYLGGMAGALQGSPRSRHFRRW